MSGWWLVLALLVVVAAFVVYLSSLAGRLDRLHKRTEVSAEKLQTALQLRRDCADRVAACGALDPSSALLIEDAVLHVDATDPSNTVAVSLAESDLSVVVSAVFTDPAEVDLLVTHPGGGCVADLADACRRVEIARRFYNDAISSARALRSRPVVRLFRLQGSAVLPATSEMVDTPPAGFAGR